MLAATKPTFWPQKHRPLSTAMIIGMLIPNSQPVIKCHVTCLKTALLAFNSTSFQFIIIIMIAKTLQMKLFISNIFMSVKLMPSTKECVIVDFFFPGYRVWKLLVVFPWLDQTRQAGPGPSTELEKHTSTGTIAGQMWCCVYLPYSFALLFIFISLSVWKPYFHCWDFFLKIKSLFKHWRHVRKV